MDCHPGLGISNGGEAGSGMKARGKRSFRFLAVTLVSCAAFLLFPSLGLGEELVFQYSVEGPGPDRDFSDPTALFYDSKFQRIYVYDQGVGRIFGFTLHGVNVGEMEASGPAVVDANGLFYVIEEGGSTVKIQRYTTVIRKKDFRSAGGRNPIAFSRICRDDRNRFYVVDRGNQRVLVIDADLNLERIVGGPEKENGAIQEICAVTVDRRGSIYISDSRGSPIHIFGANGGMPRSLGMNGLSDSRYSNPQGLAVDRLGQIWVADANAGKVKVGDSSGWIKRAFGVYGQGRGQFFKPVDIAVDIYSRVYVLERGTKRLQAFIQKTPDHPYRLNQNPEPWVTQWK